MGLFCVSGVSACLWPKCWSWSTLQFKRRRTPRLLTRGKFLITMPRRSTLKLFSLVQRRALVLVGNGLMVLPGNGLTLVKFSNCYRGLLNGRLLTARPRWNLRVMTLYPLWMYLVECELTLRARWRSCVRSVLNRNNALVTEWAPKKMDALNCPLRLSGNCMSSRSGNMATLIRPAWYRKGNALKCLRPIYRWDFTTGGSVRFGRRLWFHRRVNWWHRRR